MPTLVTRLVRPMMAAALALSFAACSPELLDSPVPEPAGPHPELAPYALALEIDVATARVRAVSAVEAGTSAAGMANSLIGNAEVAPTISNITRGPAVNGRVALRFDVALTSLLNSGNLVTPTFPLPPAGVQGLLLIPFQIRDKQGPGTVREGPEWDGAPYNFFNDFNCTGNSGGNDCYPYELFPAPLAPLASTAARTVGFDIDSRVRSFTVLMILAADISNTPLPPPASGAIAGRVTSPTAGALRGVTVTAGQETPIVTDLAGGYQFTGVPVGEVTVSLSNLPEGCTAPRSQTAVVLPGGLATADFSVSCPAPPATTGTVAGTVTSPTLGNLYGVVAVVNPGNRGGATDGAGAYAVPGVPAGQVTVTLSNLPAGCVNPGAQNATVAAGTSVPVNFSVTCAGTGGGGTGTITGTLHGTGGALSDVVVTMQPGNLTATSDPTGVFSFRDLTPGTVLLTFTNLPFGCTNPGSQAVEVVGGRGSVLNLQVGCTPLGTLRGRILDLDGAPVAGATVTANGGTQTGVDTTDGTGSYAIIGLAPGSYSVRAERTRCSSPVPAAAVDAYQTTTLDITVDCPASLLVNVSMTPALPGIRMLLRNPEGQDVIATSLPATRFRLSTPGIWTIHFIGQPQNCTVSGPTSFEAAQQRDFTAAVNIACPTAPLSGFVTDRDGRAVAGATVRFTRGTAQLSASTGAGGAYVAPGLEAGIWQVRAEKPGACISTDDIPQVIVDGQGHETTFVLDCPPVVSGTVTSTAGSLAAGTIVQFRPSTGMLVTVPVTNGAYTATLTPGAWTASVGVPSNCIVHPSQPVQLAQQSHQTIDLPVGCLPATGVVITPVTYDFGEWEVDIPKTATFTVTNHGSEPVATTMLEMFGDTDFRTTATDCAGGLALDAPPGGRCTFTVTFTPRATGARAATLVITFANGTVISLSLAGTGVTGSSTLMITPSAYDYGYIPVGSHADLTLTATNIGSVTAWELHFSISETLAAGFSFANALGTPGSTCMVAPVSRIAPGESCTVTIRFTPSVVGPQSAVVGLLSLDGGLTSMKLSGTGF